jgi:hypothetical protein
LNVAQVESPDEDHTLSRTADPGEQNKHSSSLLLLSVNNILRSPAAEESGEYRNMLFVCLMKVGLIGQINNVLSDEKWA